MPLPEYVIDTHALFWHLTKSPILGQNAAGIIAQAESGLAILLIPSIVFAELRILAIFRYTHWINS